MTWFSSSLVRRISGNKIMIAFPGLGERELYGCVDSGEAVAFFCTEEEKEALRSAASYTKYLEPSILMWPILQLPTKMIGKGWINALGMEAEDQKLIIELGDYSFIPGWCPYDDDKSEALSQLFFSLNKRDQGDFFLSFFEGYNHDIVPMSARSQLKMVIIKNGLSELSEQMARFPFLFPKETLEENLSRLFSGSEAPEAAQPFYRALALRSWKVIAAFFFLALGSGLTVASILATDILYSKRMRKTGENVSAFYELFKKEPPIVLK